MDRAASGDLDFVKSNLYSLYEWCISLESEIGRLKALIKTLEDKIK